MASAPDRATSESTTYPKAIAPGPAFVVGLTTDRDRAVFARLPPNAKSSRERAFDRAGPRAGTELALGAKRAGYFRPRLDNTKEKVASMKSRLCMSALILTLLFAADVFAADALACGPAGGAAGPGGLAGSGPAPSGSGMLGIGAPMYPVGMYNLAALMPATNYQQAYAMWMQNQKLREQTYFDMRRTDASYRAEQEMEHSHATPEQSDGFNRARLPAVLSASEFDAMKGVIQWPALLNRKQFDDSRARLEGLFRQAAADPRGSGLGTPNYHDIQRTIGEMKNVLHSEMAQFQSDEYIPATKFLKSLAFAARTPAGDAMAKK